MVGCRRAQLRGAPETGWLVVLAEPVCPDRRDKQPPGSGRTAQDSVSRLRRVRDHDSPRGRGDCDTCAVVYAVTRLAPVRFTGARIR